MPKKHNRQQRGQTAERAGIHIMAKKIKIRKVSAWTLGVTLVLAMVFAIVSFQSEKEFKILRMTTE